MQYDLLGSSDLKVSQVCLGSMTWGKQNSQQEANEQLEMALGKGVNFIDTAEMYAVPPSADTYGATETIIGHWLAKNPSRRQQVVIASKIAGPGLSYIRGGKPVDRSAIMQAVEGSLSRLQTDYLDLYQLHWPNRTSPHFGRHWPDTYRFTDVDTKRESAQMLEILEALDDCVKAGKIRYLGLSNETPWGVSEYLRLSGQHQLPRMVSVQNELSLLHTKDYPYLLEQCVRENVGYLAWSPLAGGALSGKYLGGKRPDGSRWTMLQRNGLFRNTQASEQAIREYVALADEFRLTPSQLALCWCREVEGVSSVIIGATSTEQLSENLTAFEQPLSDDQKNYLVETLRAHPAPF